VLNGRRAPSESARQAIAKLERLDCEVKIILGDVSQEADVAALFDEIRDSPLPSLKGIVHAAGIDALVPLHELQREQGDAPQPSEQKDFENRPDDVAEPHAAEAQRAVQNLSHN